VLRLGESVVLRTLVGNESMLDTDEVVQCYVLPPKAVNSPRATLIDFERVSVRAASSVLVEFRIASERLSQIDENGNALWLPGRYEFVVGSASPGTRAAELGSPAPATGVVQLL
jgi:hypothetical protein